MYGARHWFLAAPHNTMNQVQSTFDWLREWQAPPVEERDERVMRCEQRAGDLIYVPQQWWHATLNVQESVGFAQQLGGRRGLFEHQVRWVTWLGYRPSVCAWLTRLCCGAQLQLPRR